MINGLQNAGKNCILQVLTGGANGSHWLLPQMPYNKIASKMANQALRAKKLP